MRFLKKVEAAKLLATSPSLEGITKMIGEYFYSKDVKLEPTSEKEWSVSNAKGLLKDFKVVKKGSRYRFEEV